ncbi:hypothetical protein OH77DRAFT_1521581 [Trametes cingulata]|nr:hypothetical protein OH77DRAFT_1521581 [Trametes cingulata]
MGNTDKYRLYLATYHTRLSVPGGAPQIHWALLLGPKHEDPGSLQKTHVLYHATNHTTGGRWEFARRAVECVRSPSMLGRILVCKVDPKDLGEVERVLADPRRVRGQDPRWDCWVWVAEALVDLVRHGLVQWQAKGGVDVGHLFAYGQRFSADVLRSGLDVGSGIPPTVTYPGPGAIPDRIIK